MPKTVQGFWIDSRWENLISKLAKKFELKKGEIVEKALLEFMENKVKEIKGADYIW